MPACLPAQVEKGEIHLVFIATKSPYELQLLLPEEKVDEAMLAHIFFYNGQHLNDGVFPFMPRHDSQRLSRWNDDLIK